MKGKAVSGPRAVLSRSAPGYSLCATAPIPWSGALAGSQEYGVSKDRAQSTLL